MCGLNTVGLRRAGIPASERLELKELYHLLFRSDLNLRDALAGAGKRFSSGPARVMMEFVAGARRGVVVDLSRRGEEEMDEQEETDRAEKHAGR